MKAPEEELDEEYLTDSGYKSFAKLRQNKCYNIPALELALDQLIVRNYSRTEHNTRKKNKNPCDYKPAVSVALVRMDALIRVQWRNSLTGGPWTNYIKGPIPHFEFTEEFIIIKVLTKITISLNTKQ